MKTNEVQSHLKQYAQNFEHFQDTLSKSNEIFVTFKQEMERVCILRNWKQSVY